MTREYPTVEGFTNRFVEGLTDNQTFTARQIGYQYSYEVQRIATTAKTAPKVIRPYDDTIGRFLRQRRADFNDVHYFDRSRAIWWKSDHDATPDERRRHGVHN